MLVNKESTLNQEEEIPMFEETDDVEETTESEEPEVTETTQQEEVATPSDEFELKYNGELIKVSKDEMIALAQKGKNYDKVLQERDSLRNSTEIQMLDRLAKSQGMNRQQLMEAFESSLVAQERQSIVNDLRNQYPDAPEELLNKTAEGILSQRKTDTVQQENQRQEEVRKERYRTDIESFMKAFPEVDIQKNFTDEMLKEAAQKGLVAVWQEKLLKDKETEIESLKQQAKRVEQEEKNKAQSLGSVGSEGSDDSDALLNMLLS